MKKLYFLFAALVAGFSSFGQAVPVAMPGGDMETWRSNVAGFAPAVTIHAPSAWYGFDSLLIVNGEFFLTGHNWYAQLYQENTIKNGGSSSAKIISKRQDTLLGVAPGVMSNAKVSINVLSLIGGGDIESATTFTGGTPVSLRITSVSAYVQYTAGIDSVTGMWGGNDTALLTVQAYAIVRGNDSLVGIGSVPIYPSTSFSQVTANLVYSDTVDSVKNVRIIFTSSTARKSLDSSTLYVDDVTMMGVPQPPYVNAVNNIAGNNTPVNVYPNPASGVIFFESPKNTRLTCTLYAANGKAAATKLLTGNDTLDVSQLPPGLYFYNIADAGGTIVQQGKVTINK